MRAAWLLPLGHQADHGLDPDDCDDSDDWISISTPTLPPMAMRRVSTTGRLDPWFQVRRSVQRAREPSPACGYKQRGDSSEMSGYNCRCDGLGRRNTVRRVPAAHPIDTKT